MLEQSEETWSPVLPNDLVFIDRDYGRLIVMRETGRGIGLVGCIVRKSDNEWKKRTSPLVIADPDDIAIKMREGRYTTGEKLSLLRH